MSIVWHTSRISSRNLDTTAPERIGLRYFVIHIVIHAMILDGADRNWLESSIFDTRIYRWVDATSSPNRAHKIFACPEMHTRFSMTHEQSPVDHHRTFDLQKANFKRDAELGEYPQAHVDMVGHQVTFP